MRTDCPPNDDLVQLISALIDDSLSEHDHVRLCRMLADDPTLRGEYYRQVRMHAQLMWNSHPAPDVPGFEGDFALPANVLPSVDSMPLVGSPPVQAAASTFSFLRSSLTSTDLVAGWPMAYLIAAVVCSFGLLVASLSYRSLPSQVADSRPVEEVREVAAPIATAWITGMEHCVFDEPRINAKSQPAQRKVFALQSAFAVGDRIALSSGLLEVTYRTGAKVLLQGPVRYEVNSDQGGLLSLGRLTALVENKTASGEHAAGGGQSADSRPGLFSIETPTAIVTDLGTEFGVEVDRQGTTISHVYRGSVRVQGTATHGAVGPAERILHEDESVCVERRGEGATITILGALSPSHFVRDIPNRTTSNQVKVFDLVDVVAGGNGFSGKRNAGIDPSNGQVRDSLQKPALTEKVYVVGDRQYHRVSSLPLVDGVLIPDGSLGRVQVDSGGDVFDGFPATSNQTYGYLWAGGVLSAGPPNIPTVLGNVDYAAAEHGVLYLPSNQAITFSLDAIRRANPAWKVTRFRAVAGNTETAPAGDKTVWADLWVLVDGEKRFRRREISSYSGAFPIVVHLSDNDHFLTLASTDGGNGIDWDWVLFGDPRLELATLREADGIDRQRPADGAAR